MTLSLLTGLLITIFTMNAPAALKPGDVAADFKLKNVDGKMVSLSDFKNVKGYIVVFTCNHCPYAKAYEDRLIAINDKYSKQGYPVIAINPNDPSAEPEDSFDEMKVRAKQKGFKFPYLMDEGQKIYPQYGATKTPHVFLLDSKRVVKYIGSIDDSPTDASAVKAKYLEDAIAALQAGKDIIPNVTKALGCSIKVKKA
ncbi:MAG: thioredoxin family protein [Saprospiraceae bacterium]|nr:thioredoxin family protein [Saprospiraceae bacterium]